MTLPAFAAERRAAAPLLLGAGARRCRLICPARGALSSKLAARRSDCERCDRRTDRQTDGRTPDRYIDPVPHTMRAVSKTYTVHFSENTRFYHNLQVT